MKVVIDTNVLLISISKKSPYRPIFEALINGKIQLVISNEILSEYAEVLEARTNATVAINITDFLSKSTHVDRVDVYYRWNLIQIDKDDNKFVDCAVAGNAQFIVTNDRHFDILKDVPFPKIEIISSKDFLKKVKRLK